MININEDKPIYTMKISIQIDFDEYKDEYGDDISEYLEERYKDALEEEYHNILVDHDEELEMWITERFKDFTGVEIQKVNDLGRMVLSISNFKEITDGDSDE